ncbi:MAG: DUF2799 domain-containing protein [Gammaproteobacteria bacterium]|nr:DUF2799 domain-containing protein [Gammaproteobacteria bacterium]
MHKTRLNPKVVVFILSATLASSCTLMTERECKNANWYSVGMKDGMDGAGLSRSLNYVEVCGKHQVSVDVNEYERGYKFGLMSFCTDDKARRAGEAGRTYNFEICDGEVKDLIARAYLEGKINRHKRNFNEIHAQQQVVMTKVRELEKELMYTKFQNPMLKMKFDELLKAIKSQSNNIDRDHGF